MESRSTSDKVHVVAVIYFVDREHANFVAAPGSGARPPLGAQGSESAGAGAGLRGYRRGCGAPLASVRAEASDPPRSRAAVVLMAQSGGLRLEDRVHSAAV